MQLVLKLPTSTPSINKTHKNSRKTSVDVYNSSVWASALRLFLYTLLGILSNERINESIRPHPIPIFHM